MFVVPRETPGINILRNVGLGYEPRGGGREGYVSYEDVRVPADHMLGPRGGAFVVAQTRLGGGRIHHAMRTVGLVRRIFDMLCERAVSRYTQGEMLGNKQMVQEMIADSWMEIESFRLLTLQTAWKIDQYNDYRAVRADISAVKAMMQKVLHDVSARALQLHGSLGVTHEMPFVEYLVESFVLGLADGPTEVHKVTLARQLLKGYQPAADLFPSEHLLPSEGGSGGEGGRQAAGHPVGPDPRWNLQCTGRAAPSLGSSIDLLARLRVEVRQRVAWPVAVRLHIVGLDQFGSDSVVVVAVELVLVSPRVDEIERPAQVEVHEIGEYERLAARIVDPAR